jgi:CubicO group peptidase (beta-lactamase class C family)
MSQPSSGPPLRARSAALVIGVLSIACGSDDEHGPGSGAPVPVPRSIQEYLGTLAQRGELTGSVFVSRRGTVLVEQGYGLADEVPKTPDLATTQFRIGSNTKQFTAMAIWLLAEDGKLQLAEKICDYVDDCPAAWKELTLQHLLDHTSGIPDYTNFDDFPARIGTPATEAQLIDRFRDRPLEFAPGTRWKYSNSGYILLGQVVSRVSGQPYPDFLRDRIFQPLALGNTVYDLNAPPRATHATGYLEPGVEPVFLDMTEFDAAGAMASTVGDLARWVRALLDGSLLPATEVAEMFRPKIACPPGGCALASDVGYADGWFVSDVDGARYVYHWGRIDGFRSSNGFYPEDDVIVVVLSNLETVDVFGISTTLGAMARASPGD